MNQSTLKIEKKTRLFWKEKLTLLERKKHIFCFTFGHEYDDYLLNEIV